MVSCTELSMAQLIGSSNKERNRTPNNGIFAPYPGIHNDRIDTKKFLIASRGVVEMIDKFGKLFAPVKYDMQGNIEKLHAKFAMDKEVNATLQDMILLETVIGECTVAADALLWLTRDLHMIQQFFEKIVEDSKSDKGTEDLVALLKKVYEETLEPYHGWMAKQLFGLLSRMVPSRTCILQILASESSAKEDAILDIIHNFTMSLKANVTAVQKFYEDNGLGNNRI